MKVIGKSFGSIGESQRLLVMVGQQRSGSTALRLILSRAKHIHCFGEVFHSLCRQEDIDEARKAYISIYDSYFKFKVEACKENPELIIPFEGHQRKLFRTFIAFLRARSPKSILALDIKYSSWHHFNTVWSDPVLIPLQIKLFGEAKTCFVHLIRRDLVAQACSQYIASKSNVWHVGASDEICTQSISVPGGYVNYFIRKTLLERTQFRKWLSLNSRYVEIEYESLFTDDALSNETKMQLENLLHVKLDCTDKSPIRKIGYDLEKKVDNLKELYLVYRRLYED